MNRNHETFAVTLVNDKKGIKKILQVRGNEFILDAAEEESLNLPYSCRAGACFDCLAKVVEGSVEQTDKALSFLKPDEIAAGYSLLCASSPQSDCKIVTHQEEEFFA